MKNFLIIITSKFCFIIFVLYLVYFVTLCIFYLFSLSFLDHAEPNIAIVSYIFQKGGLIYHGLDSPQIYSTVYGPMPYIINGFFMNLFGPSIFVSKIGGVASAILSLALLFFILRDNLGNNLSVSYLGYAAFVYLISGPVVFWNRPDPYIIFFLSLGLFCITKCNKLMALLISGIAVGVLINLKIHAWLYFIPVYVLFYSKYGRRFLILSLAIGTFVAALPFVVFKNIILKNYISFLFVAARHGFSAAQFFKNLNFIFYFLMFIPFLFGSLFFYITSKNLKKVYQNNYIYIFSLFISSIIVAFFGAKKGSNIAHLMPLLPLYAYFFMLVFNKSSYSLGLSIQNRYSVIILIVTIVWLISSIISPIKKSDYIGNIMRFSKNKARESDITNDIKNILKKYPNNVIEMGYGGDYFLTYYKPLLVFASKHYLIDVPALMDLEFAGFSIPNSTLRYLADCKIDLFLVPITTEPFGLRNSYDMSKELFGVEFKKSFFDNYVWKERSKYFDIWICKRKCS